MALEIIFAVSGAMVALLILGKLWEEKREKPVLVLSLISKGDERMRLLSHDIARIYADGKNRAQFFLYKQLPLRTRNFVNKTNTLVKEKLESYVGNIRGSKFLKKSEGGISEFFQALEEKEEGRIDETLPGDDSTPSF